MHCRILNLGGGIRGLVAALVAIAAIEKQINQPLNEYFQCIYSAIDGGVVNEITVLSINTADRTRIIGGAKEQRSKGAESISINHQRFNHQPSTLQRSNYQPTTNES